MLVRSTLEKILPVHEGESRLWDREERAKVFKGRYFRRTFERLTQEKAPDAPHATDEHGLALPIGRFRDVAIRTGMLGVEHRGRGGVFAPESTPYKGGDVLPEHKLRIQHVESVARILKASTAVLLAAGATAFGAIERPDLSIPLPFGAEENGALISAPLGEAIAPTIHEAPRP